MHIKSKETFASFLAGLAISIFIVTPVILNLFNILYPKECESLAGQSQNEFQKKLDTLFPERLQIVKELPYKTVPAEIPVHAQSAILIDAQKKVKYRSTIRFPFRLKAGQSIFRVTLQ